MKNTFSGALDEVNKVIYEQTRQVKGDAQALIQQTNLNTRVSARRALVQTKDALSSRNALIAYGVALVGVGALMYLRNKRRENALPRISINAVEFEPEAYPGYSAT